MLIDHFLPKYQTVERHDITVRSTPTEVFGLLSTVDLGRSRVIRGLFRLRGLPSSVITLRRLQWSGFALLGEITDEELVLGLIGRPWRPSGDLQNINSATFKQFNLPGYAKIAWNFSVEALTDDQTGVATETRIQCLDRGSYRRFRLYWLVVGPFSAIIRREMLRVIKKEAERRAFAEVDSSK